MCGEDLDPREGGGAEPELQSEELSSRCCGRLRIEIPSFSTKCDPLHFPSLDALVVNGGPQDILDVVLPALLSSALLSRGSGAREFWIPLGCSV